MCGGPKILLRQLLDFVEFGEIFSEFARFCGCRGWLITVLIEIMWICCLVFRYGPTEIYTVRRHHCRARGDDGSPAADDGGSERGDV